MQQRFAAADGDDRSPHVGEQIEPLLHFFERHRLRLVVVLVAIAAIEIAAPHRNDVHEHRMLRRKQGFRNHAQLARARPQKTQTPAQTNTRIRLSDFSLIRHEFREIPCL